MIFITQADIRPRPSGDSGPEKPAEPAPRRTGRVRASFTVTNRRFGSIVIDCAKLELDLRIGTPLLEGNRIA